MKNPYHWQSSEPRLRIRRADVTEIARILYDGGSALVLGGRGMGKSVFLDQLRGELEELADVAVVVIDAPPPRLDIEACLRQLARALEVDVEQPIGTRELVDAWLDR